MEKLLDMVLDLLIQGHPGMDLSAALLGFLLIYTLRGEHASFGRLVLAIGLMLFFGGHLMIHITMPGGPAQAG